ncbi:MAG: beta-lactamase family protein, partial [Rhodanobacteraceae bacterium]|nr:beta-lactamase family protein [Rhodanobacteraceae bacterium]
MLKTLRVLAVLGVLMQPLLAAADTSIEAQLELRAAQFFKPGEPGGVVLVKRGDEILLRQAYGLADLENQLPMRADGVFPLASATKQFTSMAVLKLVEAGKLTL